MRRNRISSFHPVRRRSGVIASVIQTNRSVHTPVSLVMSLSGFALRFPVSAAHTSHAAGPSDARNASGLTALIVLAEVHSTVQARHLIAVAVEHQRFAHEEFADAAFRGLTPADGIHGRI